MTSNSNKRPLPGESLHTVEVRMKKVLNERDEKSIIRVRLLRQICSYVKEVEFDRIFLCFVTVVLNPLSTGGTSSYILKADLRGDFQ